MKRFVIAAALASTLAACGTTGGLPTSTEINDKVKQVQQITSTACKFIPTVSTIVSIFSKSAGSAFSVASDICAAISTAPLADGPGKPGAYSHGVRIRGKHI